MYIDDSMDLDLNCIPSINVLASSYHHSQNRANTAPPPIQKVRKMRTPKAASGKNSRLAISAAMERDKRSSQLKSYGYLTAPQPAQVARRNERERNRVKQVNQGFAKLRQYVPSGSANKKLSKVETLRSAVEYIRGMEKVLSDPSLNAFVKMNSEKDVGCAPEDRSMTDKNEPHASTSVLHCMVNFPTGCISSESGHLLDQAASASVPAQMDFDFFKIEDNSNDFSWYTPQ